jgi:uncharacterized protein
MIELNIFSAFIVGLLGGGHCIGMCGGIVSAVSMHLHRDQKRPYQFLFHLSYNLGRIFTYTTAGCIAGLVGSSAFFLNHILPISKILYLMSNLMLVLLGLYLASFWNILSLIESLGRGLWKKIQPLSAQFIPVKNNIQAFALGLIWGWLPCGLIYSVLVAAIASGTPVKGAFLMFAFGMGTLPIMLSMGLGASQFKSYLQNRWSRRIAGIMMIAYGCSGLLKIVPLSS